VTEEMWGELVQLADSAKVVGIGEAGLDYYRDLSDRGRQRELFERHLELSRRKDLPVIVHSRDAHADMLAMLKSASGKGELRGVMHCFTGDEAMAEACMGLGMLISFGGTVTFPNAREVQGVCRAVPLERMLVETDAPYLAPQARRGKRNEPAFVRFTAEKVAELKGTTAEEVGRVTSLNAEKLFGLAALAP
jgi:TatD DNase family protein